MKTLMVGLAISVIAMAQTPAPVPEPVPVEGKDLKIVPGPLTSSDPHSDPMPLMGVSRMDLGMRRSARRAGTIPAVDVPPGDVAVAHQTVYPAGWQAYRVEAGPGETVKARLRGSHEAWFMVRCVGKMGQLEKGMLQNRIGTGNPEASFINPKAVPATVYFVVDTTDTSGAREPYTLVITRSKKAKEAK
jgi:hypothetical protein